MNQDLDKVKTVLVEIAKMTCSKSELALAAIFKTVEQTLVELENNEVEFGCLRRDDSCHWYLIPEKLLRHFDELNAKTDDDDACAEFCQLFDVFRLGGGPQDLRISMDELTR